MWGAPTSQFPLLHHINFTQVTNLRCPHFPFPLQCLPPQILPELKKFYFLPRWPLLTLSSQHVSVKYNNFPLVFTQIKLSIPPFISDLSRHPYDNLQDFLPMFTSPKPSILQSFMTGYISLKIFNPETLFPNIISPGTANCALTIVTGYMLHV